MDDGASLTMHPVRQHRLAAGAEPDAQGWHEDLVRGAGARPAAQQHRAPIEVLRAHGAHITCDDFGTQEWRMLTGLVEYLPRLGMKGVCEEGRDTATYRIGRDYQQGYAYAMPSPLSRWA
jgi:hypothetical protein